MSDWDTSIERDIIRHINENLAAAAIYLVNQIKAVLNDTQPYLQVTSKSGKVYIIGLDPSLPGNPPKKRIGILQKSITWGQDKKEMTAEVGTAYEVGAHLELGTSKMQPRPYLRSTMDKEQAKVNQILGTGF